MFASTTQELSRGQLRSAPGIGLNFASNASILPHCIKVQSASVPLSVWFDCRLKFVIDHAAKPEIAEGKIEEWKRGMKMLAQNPNVYCKM